MGELISLGIGASLAAFPVLHGGVEEVLLETDRPRYLKELSWWGHSDLSSLGGQAVRIRFYLQEADPYSVASQ